jgi:hypothetical protein
LKYIDKKKCIEYTQENGYWRGCSIESMESIANEYAAVLFCVPDTVRVYMEYLDRLHREYVLVVLQKDVEVFKKEISKSVYSSREIESAVSVLYECNKKLSSSFFARAQVVPAYLTSESEDQWSIQATESVHSRMLKKKRLLGSAYGVSRK